MQETKTEFIKLYSGGMTVNEAMAALGMPAWLGYVWKRQEGLNVERWQRVGMPAVFSGSTEEIIFGTLLGDGSLTKDGKCKYRRLTISHCQKQSEYILWLRKQLLELKPTEVKNSGDKWGTLRFSTPPHPVFNEIYNICYPEGKKSVTDEWLLKLTPLSLAVWYMDDGGCQYCCKIATCSFDISQCQKIVGLLKSKWGVTSKVTNYDYPRIVMDKSGSSVFKEIIGPYVIPSMRYKLEPSKYDPVARRENYLKRKARNAS